jgi:cell division protease FtsH
MDGFKEDESIIIVGSTNQEQLLDSALIRSGRFDRKIEFHLPNKEEREEILRIHLSKRHQNISEECLKNVAEKCKDCSGADIESMVNQAGYNSLSNEDSKIDDKALDTACDDIMNKKLSFEKFHNQKKDWNFRQLDLERHIKY